MTHSVLSPGYKSLCGRTGRGDQLNARQLKTHFIAQIASQQTTTKQENIEANTFFAFCDVYPIISVLSEHCVAFESLYE